MWIMLKGGVLNSTGSLPRKGSEKLDLKNKKLARQRSG